MSKEKKTLSKAQNGNDFIADFVESATDKMLMRLPVCLDWVEYKGDEVVMQWNVEATEKAKKPMVDISYCMTKALNQVILKTVQWDKSKFKPSHLGSSQW